MPEIGGRHYMNPAYGRAIAEEQEEDARSRSLGTAAHGKLKHISVHPQREGGFSVHAHYEHPRGGHHTVESKHASAEDSSEEVKKHLRGHEARCARQNGAEPEDKAED